MSETCVYLPHAKRKRKTRTTKSIKREHGQSLPGPQVAGLSTATDSTLLGHSISQHDGRSLELAFQAPNQIPGLGVAGPSSYAQPFVGSAPQPWTSLPLFQTGTAHHQDTSPVDSSHMIAPNMDLLNELFSRSNASHGETAQPWSWNDLLALDPAITSTQDPERNTAGLAPSPGSQPSPTARIKGKQRVRVPYFRFFGRSAIAPGYKAVFYDASAPPSPKLAGSSIDQSLIVTPIQPNIMDDNLEYPHPTAFVHLWPIFVEHFAYFFPFLRFDLTQLEGEYQRQPSHLLNIICGLAARYSPLYHREATATDPFPHQNAASHIWASKAKEQISRDLSFSSAPMVSTLILISWYEFARDRDGGLWMYSGMGLRMGQDLGLDSLAQQSLSGGTPFVIGSEGNDELDAWRLHCSLLMMDAIMTIGTGRYGMYLSKRTTVPTFPPLSSRSGEHLPDPFEWLARVLVLVDRTARILAREESSDADAQAQLERAQSDLNAFQTSLPAELRFETSTFQKYAMINQGSAFVLLHLWFHTSAKTITDIASFAELIDPKAVTQPWINYPIYTAGRTFLSQSLLLEAAQVDTQEPKPAGQVHLAKTARNNFQRVISILTTLQSYWFGVRYIRSTLMQKAEGVHTITLIDGDETQGDQELPSPLAALWSGTTPPGGHSGVVGLSFTGTMNSPTDNFFSLLTAAPAA
ncbi:hypothetical protein IAU60_004325 [Kwoniella sp. DSM 27419]